MSKLRSDELVNMEGDGAPSFPQGATSIEPTADNQVATKLYVDSSLSAASGNAVSDTAPTNPSVGSFWTDTSVSPSILKTWNGSMWIEFAGTAAAAVGVVVSLPSLSATNLEHAPATITASAAQVSNATLFITKWYKDDVEIAGATGSTYVATEPGVYRYEERWADNAGNILTPSLNKTIQLLAIEAPSITSPVVDSGVPDFDYTAVSSAITNIDSQTTLDDFTHITSRTGQYEYIESDQNGSVFVTADVSSSDYFEISTDGGATWSNSNTVTSTPWLSLRGHCFVDSSSYKGFIFSSYGPTGSGGDTPTFKSAQGNYLSWSQAGTIPSYSSSQGRYDQIATDNNGFIVAAGSYSNVAYSTNNATSWTRVSPGSGGTNTSLPHWTACTYFAKLGKFVIGGSNQSSAGNRVYISGDTSQVQSGSWTIHDSASNPPGIDDMACNDDYLFAVSFSSSSVWRTSDLTSWTQIADFSGTDISPYTIKVKGSIILLSDFSTTGNTGDVIASSDGGANWIYKKINSGDTFGSFDAAIDKDNNIVAVNDRKSPKVARTTLNVTTTLTLTDTTVSKVLDGSLVGGESIDQVLTVGETVQADTAVASTVTAPVLSATTYTGNGGSITVPTGVDLSGKSLVWCKPSNIGDHKLFSAEGNCMLVSNLNYGKLNGTFPLSDYITFGTDSYTHVNTNSGANNSGVTYASWNFRAAPGFFDIQTYTGDGNGNGLENLSHQLGSEPAMIILKRTSASGAWYVYHKDLDTTVTGSLNKFLMLDGNNTVQSYSGGSWTSDSTTYTAPYGINSNFSGSEYVSYLFADTPGKIKCGTYTGTGSSSQTIDCGFEAGFVLIKAVDRASDWVVTDYQLMASGQYFHPNNDQELKTNGIVGSASNGFTVASGSGDVNNSGTKHIYMAIAKDIVMDITTEETASGTVSASTGNTITLSDISGTWSTGMKVQGVVTDTKDYPDPIDASAVTFASSEPVVTSGTVNTWDYAEWNLSYDVQFSTVVHEKAVPLTATGTQAGPDDFPIQSGTEYFVRTKYASFLPSGQSDWSAVTRFLTKASVYADDVFSIDLYRNDSNTEEFNNGLDMAGEGGLIVTKYTDLSSEWGWTDSERGVTKSLDSSTSGAEATEAWISSFDNDGFTHGSYIGTGDTSDVVSWSFRKAPGFFDVVTYTGNGTNQTIAHNLGSQPGFIMVKRYSSSEDWICYHRSLGQAKGLQLNGTNAEIPSIYFWNNTQPTSTHFSVGSHGRTNDPNETYVAYIFAHDDARFGTNSNESIIKCGSYTGNDSTDGPEIDLGFEPQFVMMKSTTATYNWFMADNMLGVPTGGTTHYLNPNTSGNEVATANEIDFTPTGFKLKSGNAQTNNPETYIYMAIRRPHKPATVATDVFDVGLRSGSSSDTNTNSSILTDMTFVLRRDSSIEYNGLSTRLLGDHTLMLDNSTTGTTGWLDSSKSWATMTGAIVNGGNGAANTGQLVDYSFKRAPGFFDVVTYSSVTTTTYADIPHNLGVQPELVIIKSLGGSTAWHVWSTTISQMGYLNLTHAFNAYPDNQNQYSSVFYNTDPTATTFRIGTSSASNNQSGYNYVAYLFASLDGISKVGTYSGTGGNINVDCGFTAGSRFVLIKRTDSDGDWYVWDIERGIVSGNDPYMILNERDAEVTGTDYIDPFNAGFTVNSGAPATLNASGGTYLFLAIA